MGTDIHGVFQRRTHEGNWEEIPSEYEEDRHYCLFSVLANVRNGYGFAGVKTYEPVVPISMPKGLPEDFECREEEYGEVYCGSKWLGDHSHSWLDSNEMLEWYNACSQEDEEAVGYFFKEVERLVEKHGYIRFVFGFDN